MGHPTGPVYSRSIPKPQGSHGSDDQSQFDGEIKQRSFTLLDMPHGLVVVVGVPYLRNLVRFLQKLKKLRR